MEELEREEPLFERAVPMKIQMRDREDRTGDITVRIMAGKRVRFFGCRCRFSVAAAGGRFCPGSSSSGGGSGGQQRPLVFCCCEGYSA